ncbi:COG2 [Cordylochernes scorpioides]|uniref:COG2 n=1 Tax=Cordylochernes scorpioides TaxID=51811 RepID=A0ABY6LC03_9ARAC|nr:COG2 [Cordylochernes scorpioides]
MVCHVLPLVYPAYHLFLPTPHGDPLLVGGRFHTATVDVLTSVKKMEDSLKRLKKEGRASRPNAAGMSDDDKIRLQLALDVEHYGIKVCLLDDLPSGMCCFFTG